MRVERTLDQRASLRDANYVIVAISVGGIAAWENDIEIPGRYGLFAQIADSTGPGGIMRAFRNVPVLVSASRAISPRSALPTPGSSTTPTRRRCRRWR